MKRFRQYLQFLFISTLLISSACVKQNAVGTGNANQPVNAALAKTTHAFPEMPINIMKSEIKGLDGKTFTLKDLEGKVLVVNLWATWCGPCRMEMPELVEIENDYKDKGVMVIGLDIDPEPEESVKAFVEKQQINYTIGWVKDDARDALVGISKMSGIPQSFVITSDGRLAGVLKGYAPKGTAQKIRLTLDDALNRTTE
jgi:thiol-disulfide isomerase/thioredoxin